MAAEHGLIGPGVIPFARPGLSGNWEDRTVTNAADFPLPADLPVPADDGLCDHLAGARMPAVSLPSTRGRTVNLGELIAPRTVI